MTTLSAGKKLETASETWHSARALKEAVFRAQHPDWTDERLRAEVRRIFLLGRTGKG